MTQKTNINMRKELIYSIFVRNFSNQGTFKGVESQLDRLKQMGVDTIWLMPVNTIGSENRKGDLGSPYAIKDYYEINSELGSESDLKNLINAIHQHQMKVMIDIVFNHTSTDSKLYKDKPEWFLHDSSGKRVNKNPEWTDVAELDYSKNDLWGYQIEVLKYYAKFVDGFRCDVAPQVPIDFWITARHEVDKVNNRLIWLAESTDKEYIRSIRSKGFWASSDGELYNAFDMTYDYDIDQLWRSYVKGKTSTADYVKALNEQTVIYPDNAIKMRALENHDQDRAHDLIPNMNDLINWTAFSGFQRGSLLIYNGQEYGIHRTPSLFTRDPIDWEAKDGDLTDLITRLHQLMQDDIQVSGDYMITEDYNDIVQVSYRLKDKIRIGIFNLKSKGGWCKVSLLDGEYQNLLNEEQVKVLNGTTEIGLDPVIIEGRL
ncbi:alpha-amylase [Pediococcus stilesii]|uniref:Alpha-amylase n=1 Tax=Pediococcus stilesii TaxID=331679 RepID=A0A5R9BVM1_9LACO|nr:alpha-amylase family glycosyl hydrolase [Pediococcus stilesii]TLQ04323.1 alpha-amylase [Pediococcus stilesii]